MKTFVLFLVSAALACGQTKVTAADRPELTADHRSQSGDTITAKGHVRVQLGPLTFEGDEITLHSESGEFELRGHATVRLPARSDRNLFRYGASIVFSEKAVTLWADTMAVKNAFLHGAGKVRIATPDASASCDEVDLFLSSADGRLKGNVQVIRNEWQGSPSSAFHEFPPDIIKK